MNFLKLEERIVLDGAALLEALDEVATIAPDASPEPSEAPTPTSPASDERLINESLSLLEGPAQTASQVLIIDGRVDDIDALSQHLSPDIELLILDAQRDGLEQISLFLAEREGITALHIVAHGDEGRVQLGTSVLDQTTLDSHQQSLALWGDALSEQGDILLWSCNVGVGASGAHFVQSLAQITGADVAASDDLTGATEHGGDWELEVNSGTIEVSRVSEILGQSTWQGILVTGDYDNDGISDIFDIDDDNDGIIDTIDTAPQDIDTDNDGIADNVEAQATGSYVAPQEYTATIPTTAQREVYDYNHNGLDDLYELADPLAVETNWVFTDGAGGEQYTWNTGFTIQGYNFTHSLSPSGAGAIAQTTFATTAGQEYVLYTMAYTGAGWGGGTVTDFSITDSTSAVLNNSLNTNGNIVANATQLNWAQDLTSLSAFTTMRVTITFTAVDTATTLSFTSLSAGVELAGFGLATGLTPVDTDGDGTPDYRDTNSDNEGAGDSGEGGGAALTGSDVNGAVNTAVLSNHLADSNNNLNATDSNASGTDINLDFREVDVDPIANNDTDSITEDTASISASTANGVIQAGGGAGQDSDANLDVITVSAITGASAGTVAGNTTGLYGTLVLNADGSYTYNLDNANATVDALNTGQSIDDVFTYTITANGKTDTATLTITINGLTPNVQAGADVNSVTEDGPALSVAANGVLGNDIDNDFGDATGLSVGSLTFSGTTLVINNGTPTRAIAGTYGTLTLNQDGSYSYAVNNANAAVDALNVGDSLNDVFSYSATDGSNSGSNTLTITINGANDAPVINNDTNSISENTASITSSAPGVLANDTDVDGPGEVVNSVAFGASVGTVGTALDGTYGSLTLNADGSYTYALHTDARFDPVDALALGESFTEVFSQTIDDGSATATSTSAAGTLTITIDGANDQPVVTDDLAATTENANITVDVISNDSDTDTSDILSVSAASVPANSGSVSFSGNNITFNPGTDFDYLAAGETVDVIVSYSAIDDNGGSSLSDSGTLTITVTGTNDQPVAADVAIAADEDGVTVNGNFSETDADTNDTHTFAITSAPTEGSVVNNNDGTFTFDPANDFQDLAFGETRDVSFTYTATDDSGAGNATSVAKTVTVTVSGANDAPVLSVGGSDSVAQAIAETDTTLSASGTVTASDVDLTNLVTASVLSVVESGTTSGLTNATLLAMLTMSGDLNATEDSDTLTWDFNSGSEAFDYLASGESLLLSFSVEIDDGTLQDTQVISITINGTNDAPVAVADTNSTTENSAVTTDVIANDSDVDASDVLQINALSLVSMSNDADASTITWGDAAFSYTSDEVTFDPGTNFDHLAVGETATVVLSYGVTNQFANPPDDSSTLTLTITGTNDAPEIRVNAAGALIEDSSPTTISASSTLLFRDLDLSDTTTVTQAFNNDALWDGGSLSAGQIATLSSGLSVAGGNWDYAIANSDLQFLGVGENITLSYTFTVTDNHGASSDQVLSLVIQGTNDGPSLIVAAGNSVFEDSNTPSLVDSGLLNLSDVDTNDIQSLSTRYNSDALWSGGTLNAAQITALSAGFSANSSSWAFSVSNAAMQFLAEGEQLTLSFQVDVVDGSGLTDTARVDITLIGVNDAPSLINDAASTDERSSVSVDVLANDSDIDSTDQIIISASSIASMINNRTGQVIPLSSASVSVVDGRLVFDPGLDLLELESIDSATVVINYTATNLAGLAPDASATLSIQVSGLDTPVDMLINTSPLEAPSKLVALAAEPVRLDFGLTTNTRLVGDSHDLSTGTGLLQNLATASASKSVESSLFELQSNELSLGQFVMPKEIGTLGRTAGASFSLGSGGDLSLDYHGIKLQQSCAELSNCEGKEGEVDFDKNLFEDVDPYPEGVLSRALFELIDAEPNDEAQDESARHETQPREFVGYSVAEALNTLESQTAPAEFTNTI